MFLKRLTVSPHAHLNKHLTPNNRTMLCMKPFWEIPALYNVYSSDIAKSTGSLIYRRNYCREAKKGRIGRHRTRSGVDRNAFTVKRGMESGSRVFYKATMIVFDRNAGRVVTLALDAGIYLKRLRGKWYPPHLLWLPLKCFDTNQ